MSDKNADVIQGRLGWERGDVSEAKPEELEPHPKNREIYGDAESVDELPDTFIQSVQEKGVLEPIVITSGKKIISGHRRWVAAQHAGLESIPICYAKFDDKLAEREALIEFNRQREKTPGQLVNEFEEVLAIEEQRAKERQSKGGGDEAGKEKFPDPDTGQARDKAAEKIEADVSGRTLEKGKTVKDKAESEDEPSEVRETAQEAWEGLQSGEESFNSAYKSVKEAEEKQESKQDIEQFTSQQTDEWSSPREIVEPLDTAVGGFDLDPCSGAEESPFAMDTYTEDDDGLTQPWYGDVWVNPPYSGVSDWVDKARNSNADCVVFLCKGDSSTEWWQRAAASASLILAIDHRLSFGDGNNSAPFPSHIFVFGESRRDLVDALSNHGTILTVGWDDE